MTDLIAELAEVVRFLHFQRRMVDEKEMESARVYSQAVDAKSSQLIRTHHAELARILTDDASIRAAHHDLVIRLGEVTTELEAARRDAELFALAERAAVKSISSHGVRFELRFDARRDSSTFRDYLSAIKEFGK